MDELAMMFDAKPNLLKHGFTGPRLAYTLLVHGLASYQFRLNVRLNSLLIKLTKKLLQLIRCIFINAKNYGRFIYL